MRGTELLASVLLIGRGMFYMFDVAIHSKESTNARKATSQQ
jgi:hypothetical protein